MTARRGSSMKARKKGGMVQISTNVETIGKGDDGCVFRDVATNTLYKMVVPYKNPAGKTMLPMEVQNVKVLHEKQIDRSIFVYPDEYQSVPIGQVQHVIHMCGNLQSTIDHFGVNEVYVARMDDAGISIRDLNHKKQYRFKKFTLKEFADILSQLEDAKNILREKGIHHNDLHDGNLCFTGLAGEPGERNIKLHIIDFGRMKTLEVTNTLDDEESIIKQVIPHLWSLVSNRGSRIDQFKKQCKRAKMLQSMLTCYNNIVEGMNESSNDASSRSVSSMNTTSPTSNTSSGKLSNESRKRGLMSHFSSVSPSAIPSDLVLPPSSYQKAYELSQSPQREDVAPTRLLYDVFDSPPTKKKAIGGKKQRKIPKTNTNNKTK